MSQDLDEQNGKKHTIRWDGEKCYAWIGEKSIMVFPPNDAGVKHQELYSLLNFACRMISKSRVLGLSWESIVEQLDGANITGNKTWCRDLAQLIRDEFLT